MQVEKYKIRLQGTSALLMHNNRCVNPTDPLKKAISAITGKRSKTDADFEQIAKLELQAGLYIDKHGPYIPQRMLRACLIAGARKQKNGKQFENGLFVCDDAPLQYDGPKDLEGLMVPYNEATGEGYAWSCVVGNQKNSIIRTRPRFDEWSIEFEVEVVSTLIDEPMLRDALTAAELQAGIGDGRSIGFGRFIGELSKVEATNQNGKPRTKAVSV